MTQPRLLLLAILLACTARGGEVRVFAAASLSEAASEAGAAYERATGERVGFNFAGSATLARQIEQGAPADVFLSADELKMDMLERKNLIVPSTRVSFLSNTLAVVVPRDGGVSVSGPADLARIRSLALAEPESVPAGIYARQYLQRQGLWESVRAKVIPTDNVRGALAAVEAGNADAAIVYKTDARLSRGVRIAFEVPAGEGPAISYSFAVTSDSAAARRFLSWLSTAEGRRIFERHGFVLRR